MEAGICMWTPHCTEGGQRLTFGSHFSPSITWTSWFKLQWSSWVASLYPLSHLAGPQICFSEGPRKMFILKPIVFLEGLQWKDYVDACPQWWSGMLVCREKQTGVSNYAHFTISMANRASGGLKPPEVSSICDAIRISDVMNCWAPSNGVFQTSVKTWSGTIKT